MLQVEATKMGFGWGLKVTHNESSNLSYTIRMLHRCYLFLWKTDALPCVPETSPET
jgi:hypothetical protein